MYRSSKVSSTWSWKKAKGIKKFGQPVQPFCWHIPAGALTNANWLSSPEGELWWFWKIVRKPSCGETSGRWKSQQMSPWRLKWEKESEKRSENVGGDSSNKKGNTIREVLRWFYLMENDCPSSISFRQEL